MATKVAMTLKELVQEAGFGECAKLDRYTVQELVDLSTCLPEKVRKQYPNIHVRWQFLRYRNTKTKRTAMVRVLAASSVDADVMVRQAASSKLSAEWELEATDSAPVTLPFASRPVVARVGPVDAVREAFGL